MIGSRTIRPTDRFPTGAGSAKLSYVLLQKLLKLSKYLPRRGRNASPTTTDGATASTTSDSNSNGSDGGAGGGFCFKYVITDFSHANFGFWMNHPRLQELFALGVVDFAVFDAEAGPGGVGGVDPSTAAEGDAGGPAAENGAGASTGSGSRGSSSSGEGGRGGEPGVGLWGSGCLRLELSGEELRPGDLDNPVIVVANYVFDSLKQDAFR